ncbi:MAG: hypothetical protein ACRD0Q_03850 [Acidimicrobiales bacterium]
MQKELSRRVTIAGRAFELDAGQVEESLAGVLPEPIRDHFVVLGGRRFPLKQALAAVTGLDRADFTTYQARSILRRLGLATGRLSGPLPPGGGSAPAEDPALVAEADELRPHRGRWVAMKESRVLVSADDPRAVLAWLRRHNQVADTMLAVPLDPASHMGGFGS